MRFAEEFAIFTNVVPMGTRVVIHHTFVYARKIYVPTHIKITRQWKSTSTPSFTRSEREKRICRASCSGAPSRRRKVSLFCLQHRIRNNLITRARSPASSSSYLRVPTCVAQELKGGFPMSRKYVGQKPINNRLL